MAENISFCKVENAECVKNHEVRKFAVIDSNLEVQFAQEGILQDTEIFVLEASEQVKTMETVERIVEWLLEKEAGRDVLLLGIGGGIVTDITGFVASIYKRGVRYVLVPTTLLAQVDAAVGGKNGVNFAGLKNVVGTFSQAEETVIDTGLLRTLPEREFHAGLAEVLKTFLIGDARMYGETVAFFRKQDCKEVMETVQGQDFVARMVRRCVEIKVAIVDRDRCEAGLRRVLNLGHTVGHALEAYSQGIVAAEGYAGRGIAEAGMKPGAAGLSHGEAVAAGIMAQVQMAARRGLCTQETAFKVEADLRGLGYKGVREIAIEFSDVPYGDFAKKLAGFIRNDKKRNEDFINFVLNTDIGSVRIEPISVEDIEREINDLH